MSKQEPLSVVRDGYPKIIRGDDGAVRSMCIEWRLTPRGMAVYRDWCRGLTISSAESPWVEAKHLDHQ